MRSCVACDSGRNQHDQRRLRQRAGVGLQLVHGIRACIRTRVVPRNLNPISPYIRDISCFAQLNHCGGTLA
jgi:hypothetical protein